MMMTIRTGSPHDPLKKTNKKTPRPRPAHYRPTKEDSRTTTTPPPYEPGPTTTRPTRYDSGNAGPTALPLLLPPSNRLTAGPEPKIRHHQLHIITNPTPLPILLLIITTSLPPIHPESATTTPSTPSTTHSPSPHRTRTSHHSLPSSPPGPTIPTIPILPHPPPASSYSLLLLPPLPTKLPLLPPPP